MSGVSAHCAWLLCAGFARELSVRAHGNGVKMVPWVGVAARLDGGRDQGPVQGTAFCFLPLPIPTNLPVHVNAYFELSSNRRDIWWAGGVCVHTASRAGFDWGCIWGS